MPEPIDLCGGHLLPHTHHLHPLCQACLRHEPPKYAVVLRITLIAPPPFVKGRCPAWVPIPPTEEDT